MFFLELKTSLEVAKRIHEVLIQKHGFKNKI